jgi:hypothetical protein
MIRRLSFVILALVVVAGYLFGQKVSRDFGWSGYLTGKNSTQRGDR